jgi:hypothetical protein
MGLLDRSPLLRRRLAEIDERAAAEKRKLLEDADRDEAREHESRRRSEDQLVEGYVRYGSPLELERVPSHRREEAERRRAEVVERMRKADADADRVAPRGLRSAFPRGSRA